MERVLLCTVKTRDEAARIVDALVEAGIGRDDISVLCFKKHETRVFARATHTRSPVHASGGVTAAGVMAGTLGLATGFTLVGIPGPGPFLAAGPIIAGLAGLAASVGGGIGGVLRGYGVDEREALLYEDRLRGDHVVIGVHSDDHATRVRAADVFRTNGAADISSIDDPHVLYDVRTDLR